MNGYISVSLMINNSVLAETRGIINGISQSLVAVGRGVGPSVGSLSFAWSENNGKSLLIQCIIFSRF